jgi:hypothetical protein
LSGFGAVTLLATSGVTLLAATAGLAALALGALIRAVWPLRHAPTAAQLARLVEERVPNLNDLVVTAVDAAERPDVSPRMRDWLAADAGQALCAIDLDAVVDRRSLRHAALQAAAATIALAVGVALMAPPFSRGASVAAAYLFPSRLQLEVLPGHARVRAGDPLTVAVRLAGAADGSLVPEMSIRVGGDTRSVPMTAAGEGSFSVTLDRVTVPFDYVVSAAGARSETYGVEVLHPPHVERIDLQYEFPKGLGLVPRTDEDSGDIYGPAGTTVRLAVTADKPIASAALVLEDGTRVPLDAAGTALAGALTIDEDSSYRVALVDRDGLENAGETEYFIRTLDDRPPDVRIVRPASDKHVTPLEEVPIEARADDDYGIASFDLVFQTPAGRERIVPLGAGRGSLTASAMHTLFMEDLGVAPGDFVTYYARARDVSRGRRSTEARSDIFFLEVKPFEEEFVAAQSQAMGQGGGMQNDTGLEALVEAQKEIIVATWKLDARARRARDRAAIDDVKAVSRAQGELRTRTEQAAAQSARANDPRRRRALGGAAPADDPIGRAVEAMGRAVNELDKPSTSSALPHEMDALNQLLRAMAEIRRRQVTRSQQAGGGGGANRSQADLSSLFDQELRRRQQTNYETPNSTETQAENPQDDLLERIRELARRQDALNRQHRDLSQNRDRLEEAELRRQLERLTREQNDLRQQAEQLAQRLQQSGSTQSGSGQSAGQDSRQLREISEDMRNAATGMRREDRSQASASGARASERLRELEQQMRTSRPDDRRRALGDVQLETRQLADAQRRLANESDRAARGTAGDDARRRLAGEQERLAERTERLEEQVTRLSRSGQGGPSEDRRATEDAARALRQDKVAERMRQSADTLRQPSERGAPDDRDRSAAAGRSEPPPSDPGRDVARQGEALARALDRIADRLGAATGTADRDSQRLSDQLARTQELRDRMASLERTIEELRRQAESEERRGDTSPSQQGQQGAEQAGRQGPQQAQGQSSAPQQSGQGAQPSASGRDGASGQQGGSTGGNGGRLQQLQREVNEGMREAQRLTAEMRQQNPGMQAPNPDEGWWRSFSAPGTEAFKQDFARWESLKQNLLVALETVETRVSGELRARENHERLNAGGHHGVDEAYRETVDRYYRSLAAPRKPR